MKHLTEDMLIQYAFDLLETDIQAEAAAHLADCGDCTRQLQQIRAKFAVLDVLDTDEPISEDLLGKTIQQTQAQVWGSAEHTETVSDGSRRSAFKPWGRWIASAAAVLLVALLIRHDLNPAPTLTTTEPEPQQTAKAPKQPEKQTTLKESNTAVATKPVNGARTRAKAIDSPAITTHISANTPPPAKTKVTTDSDTDWAMTSNDGKTELLAEAEIASNADSYAFGAADSLQAVRVVDAEEIPDKAPFAPASAIELVVLPAPDQTQVTIYNSADLTLVRDTRKLTLKPGWNWLQFMWDGTQIDPTSLSLRPLEHEAHIDIELISYPARLKDIGRWLIRSEVEGAVPFEITYFASGLSWRAFYMGTMNDDETAMSLKGYVNVANHSGQDFVNAQTRLVVGQTRLTEPINYLAGRQYPYGPEVIQGKGGGVKHSTQVDFGYKNNWKHPQFGTINDALSGELNGDVLFFSDGDFAKIPDTKQIEKKGLSEYFLYTIEGTEDLTNQWSKRLPSFDVADIPIKSLYKYDDDRYGTQPVRFVSFANDAEHELGETPIPEGSIKIYRNLNAQQNLAYVGQSDFKYIPVNEEVELNLGPARLVKVEPTLMSTRTENYTFDTKGNISGWDDVENYRVTVTNTRDIPIEMEITWNMGTACWELELVENPKNEARNTKQTQNTNVSISKTNIEYKKHDKTRARFTLTVEPRSESQFDIDIRKYRQQRQEAYVKKQNR